MAEMSGFYLNAIGDQYFVADAASATTSEVPSDIEWLELARGIETVDQDDDDETDDSSYYDGDGGTTTDVTGGTHGYQFSGDRYKGDGAQDLIVGKRFVYGNDRHVWLRHVDASGAGEQGLATVSDITATGGDANEKGAFECTIHYNGVPAAVTQAAAAKPAILGDGE